jgi:hypothetical protein
VQGASSIEVGAGSLLRGQAPARPIGASGRRSRDAGPRLRHTRASGAPPMNQTTREHLEFHLRRLKGARAAAAELALKPSSGGLELLTASHLAILALEATLAEGIEPEPSALEEVMVDLRVAAAPPLPAPAERTVMGWGGVNPLADWWRASVAPFSAFAQAARSDKR